jgi:hypothetical protein
LNGPDFLDLRLTRICHIARKSEIENQKAAVNTPQSRRFARHGYAWWSHSVWTAVASAPLLKEE